MDLHEEREELIGRILDHKDNSERDVGEVSSIAKKVRSLNNSGLRQELSRLNKKTYS